MKQENRRETRPVIPKTEEVDRMLEYQSCGSERSRNSADDIAAQAGSQPVLTAEALNAAQGESTLVGNPEAPEAPEDNQTTRPNTSARTNVGSHGSQVVHRVVDVDNGPVQNKIKITGNRVEVVADLLTFIGLFTAMIVGESNDRTSTFNTARIGAANFVNDAPQAATAIFLLSLLPWLVNMARMVSHYRDHDEEGELKRAGDYGKFAAIPYLVTLLVLTLNAGANASMQDGINSALTADPASAKSLLFMSSMIISMSIVVGWFSHLGYECAAALFHTSVARSGPPGSQGSSMSSEDGYNPEIPVTDPSTERTSLLAANRGPGSL